MFIKLTSIVFYCRSLAFQPTVQKASLFFDILLVRDNRGNQMKLNGGGSNVSKSLLWCEIARETFAELLASSSSRVFKVGNSPENWKRNNANLFKSNNNRVRHCA